MQLQREFGGKETDGGLDSQWVELILTAKEMGMTPDDIRQLLHALGDSESGQPPRIDRAV